VCVSVCGVSVLERESVCGVSVWECECVRRVYVSV
jgi:hypothetical protein